MRAANRPGVAEEESGPQPMPKAAIAIIYLLWGVTVLALTVGGFYFLFQEEPQQGPGFGLLTIGVLLLFMVGWKVRWLQKRGLMGAPPAP